MRNSVTEILGQRSTIKELRSELRAWSPEVAIDMILSSAAQARETLEALRGIARREVAISSGMSIAPWRWSTALTPARWNRFR